jgi:Nucleotide-diphospho-sugar transferase
VKQLTAKVLTFASSKYSDLLPLWWKLSRKQLLEVELDVVCLDEQTRVICGSLDGVRSVGMDYLAFDPDDRHQFWINRLRTIIDLSEGSHLVVHSDLDAFWRKPALELLEAETFHFAFSIDHAMPNEIVEKWGFILCCGFFGFRPGPASDQLLAAWLKQAEIYLDDQIALNHLLNDLDLEWSDGVMKGYPCKRGIVRMQDQEIRVLALPWQLFPRQHPMLETNAAVVVHPYWERRFHHSFVETYNALSAGTGTLEPMAFPPFPNQGEWRVRDWAMLNVFDQLATTSNLTDDQLRHYGVLCYRFGRSGEGVRILDELRAAGYQDEFLLMDLVEATGASDMPRSNELLKQAIKSSRVLKIIRKLERIARQRRRYDVCALAAAQIAKLVFSGRLLQKLVVQKVRDVSISLRRSKKVNI